LDEQKGNSQKIKGEIQEMRRKPAAVITALMFMLALSVSSALAVTRTVTIRVKGMTCGDCASKVDKALKATDGVQDAHVNYKRGRAVVKYDDQKVTVAKLREIINSTGFTCDAPGLTGKAD
jgi:mercuric transport protein